MKPDWDAINAALLGRAEGRAVEADLALQPMAPCHEREWRRHAAGMPVARLIRIR